MAQPRLHASHAERQAAYRRRQLEDRNRQSEERCGSRAAPLLILTSAHSLLPGPARWRKLAAVAASLLEQIAAEADIYYKARSASWQDSEKAECFSDRQDAIQEALDALGRVDW
jgi:hypothetical protein